VLNRRLRAVPVLFTSLAAIAATPAPPRRADGDLAFDVRDARTGAPIPCKLTFVGVHGTPTPAFTHGDIGRPQGERAIAAYDRVMSADGKGVARVPVGTYDIYVSRGLEWGIAVEREVKVGVEGASISARLERALDTAGWLSADFHVHAAHSPDSVVPMPHRIIEFVSDGMDMIVSADHNVVADYQPVIDSLGLRSLITSAPGDELTTNGWGHFGAFPLPRDLEKPGDGALLVHGRSAKEIFKGVRAHAPDAIIDVHHPRLDPTVGYFTIGGLEPHADSASKRGFSFDFDAVEVLNGYQDPVRRSVDRTIDDWLGLLNHGHIVTATGNSDTHHLDYNIGGYPRNFVRVRDDRPEQVTPKEIADALRAHRAFFTTGPFVRLRVGAGDIGDVVPARGGHALAEITVEAAPWISVDRVILYVNGKEAKRWRVPPSTGITRFKERIDIASAVDGYVVVRVDGDKLMAPVVGDTRTFGVRPLALTNPVFLDVDGNGKYDPPYRHGWH
jgi:hypothetical protein